MLAEIGFIAVALSFAASVYALVASLAGERVGGVRGGAWVESARNAGLAVFPLLGLACTMLLVALVRGEYQIAYVWKVSNPDTPLFYRITALWGSQQGSLLFWCFLMSLFTAGAFTLNWARERRLMPYVIAFSSASLIFFIGLVLFMENPFARYWVSESGQVVESVFQPAGALVPSAAGLAESARGLNPLLRHFGMIIHPPMLYLGFVGMLVPFAFAMAALASGELSSNWIRATRRWSLVAWLFLSLGLILGGRWAYDVLGWGGYWGWDPVENAAFIPWLLGTAFLHSVMIQEKRGMLKVWNMVLVVFTFSSVLFGTFATRSGLIDSVHSFAQSNIGLPMFLFWAGMTVVAVGLIVWRQHRGQLESEHGFAGVFSRETLFVLNNVVFVALALAIFWGSFGAPIASELFLNTDITIGGDYFNAVTAPLFAVMYILMGVAPVSAWGATHARRLGRGLLVPVAFTGLSLGVIALTGTTHAGALFGYGVVLLAAWVAAIETARGIGARRRATGENALAAFLGVFGRNRRRYGGFIVHLGITVIGIGVIGSTVFQARTQQTLLPGQAIAIEGYEVRFDALAAGQIADDGRVMDIATMTVLRDGETLGVIRPRHDYYPQPEGPAMQMNIAGAHSTLETDVYVLLAGANFDTGAVTFSVYVNPLVNLVWWGGLILIVGTFIAVYPHEPAPARARGRAAVAQRAGAAA
jgi:cytochrome c-type biogenesis protein CcmF